MVQAGDAEIQSKRDQQIIDHKTHNSVQVVPPHGRVIMLDLSALWKCQEEFGCSALASCHFSDCPVHHSITEPAGPASQEADKGR
jgi:hypothetical protein